MGIKTNTSPKSLTNRRRVKLTVAIGLVNVVVIAAISIHIWRLGHASTTYVVPAAINSSCGADVTASLNTWLASIPNGSNISFRAGSCYGINNRVIISGRNDLTIDGAGATFKALSSGRELPAAQARTRDQFLITNSDAITMRNMTVRGANPNAGTSDAAYVADLEAQHAFDIASSSNVTLDNVQAYDTYGDFVYMGQQGGSQPNNIVVKNSRFERNGRQGFGIAAGKNIVLQNNTMANTRRSDIDLEPNTTAWAIENVTISNNSFGTGRLLFLANAGSCGTVKNIVVENNTFTNRAMDSETAPNATCPVKRGPFRFVGNRSNTTYGTSSQAVLQFHQVSDLVVSNNTQPMQAGRNMSLVRTYSSTNVRVTGNILLTAISPILYAADTTQVCHSGNFIGNPLRAETTSAPCPTPPVPPPPPPVNPPPSVSPPVSTNSTSTTSSGAQDSGSISAGNSPSETTEAKKAELLDQIRKQRWVHQTLLQKVAAAFLIIPGVVAALWHHPSAWYTILSDEQKRTAMMIAGGIAIGLISLLFALYEPIRRKHKVKKLDKALTPPAVTPAKAAPHYPPTPPEQESPIKPPDQSDPSK